MPRNRAEWSSHLRPEVVGGNTHEQARSCEARGTGRRVSSSVSTQRLEVLTKWVT
jgi:hypothetical protein